MAIIDNSKKKFVIDREKTVSVGIDLPFRLSDVSGSGYFAQTSTTIDAVKVNVKNLLTTEIGERYLQPELGLNLRKFLFDPITPEMRLSIEEDIMATFARWLPFVQIENIIVDISENLSSNNKIKINLTFNINRHPNSLNSVEVVIGA